MLAVLGSARSDGKTARALRSVLADVEHECVDLRELLISPYDYDACYPEEDDFIPLAQKMAQHSQIVFATPVYWYAMSGLMKVFFDRLTDLITTHKSIGRSLAGRIGCVLATGTDQVEPVGFDVPFCRTFEYFDMKFSGLAYVYTGDNANKHAESLSETKHFFQAKLAGAL